MSYIPPMDILIVYTTRYKESVYMKVNEFMQAVYVDAGTKVLGTVDLEDDLLAVWVHTDQGKEVHMWDTTGGYIYVPKDRPIDLVLDTVCLYHKVDTPIKFLELVISETM